MLFHKRIVWVNRGEKTRISQCLYITCNIVKRLNLLVEENSIRVNLSYHLERSTKPRSQLWGSPAATQAFFISVKQADLGFQPNSSSAQTMSPLCLLFALSKGCSIAPHFSSQPSCPTSREQSHRCSPSANPQPGLLDLKQM